MSNLKARFLFSAGVKIAPVKGTRLERFSLKRIGKLLPSTGQDDAPPISFSPCRRKRNAHLCAKSRPAGGCAPKRRCGRQALGFWNRCSFLGIPFLCWGCPPLLFLHTRRKRRAPCTVEKKKRALVADLGGAVPLFCCTGN